MKLIRMFRCSSTLPLALNWCCRHNFNVIDAFDTSVFGISWHRWCICVHWWCADTMIWLLHWRCQAVRSNMIWSWMMWQRCGWSSCGKWRRNYGTDSCIHTTFTRLATVRWCWRCWCAQRFITVTTIRFRRCCCIESKNIRQWTLQSTKKKNKIRCWKIKINQSSIRLLW